MLSLARCGSLPPCTRRFPCFFLLPTNSKRIAFPPLPHPLPPPSRPRLPISYLYVSSLAWICFRVHVHTQVSTDRDDAKFQAESQKLQLSQLTRDVAGLKVERDGIKGQLAAAEKERDEAEKQAMALSAYASGR